MNDPIATVNATFCATLVDQWVAEGLRAAFVAPGSRSTPLVVALARHPEVAVSLFHDERSAAFAALGHALATGRPAVIACTSGTAGTHFHGAVAEADLAAVPLIVCTADRPPELWGRGAPQTINQTNLFGSAVRAFYQPGPPEAAESAKWRSLAQQAWAAAVNDTPGAVHLNLSFREPLLGDPEPLPEPIPPLAVTPPAAIEHATLDALLSMAQVERGVIVAGRNETDPALVLVLAERLRWPVIADHRSGCRTSHPVVINRYDSLLRHQLFANAHQPDAVLRLGEIVSSKAVSLWLRSGDAQCLASKPQGRLIDPERIASLTFDEAGAVRALIEALPSSEDRSSEWLDGWRHADDLAVQAVEAALGAHGNTSEIDVARTTLAAVPAGGALVVASSMPVRDVEWFGDARNDISVISNRGANGIDGTIATAIGVAKTGRPTICLIGDVALLHDATSLIGLANRTMDLTIVVVNNDGGGIFSFLPQHQILDTPNYELLFGTPHGTDFVALANAHGLPVTNWPADLTPKGVSLVVATSDRAINLTIHDQVHAAVAAALDTTT